MRILFLTHHWHTNTHHSYHSGYQRLITYVAEQHECEVVTLGRENAVRKEGEIKVHYVKPFIRKDFFFTKRLTISRYAKRIEDKFDVVHAIYSDCGFFQRHSNFFSSFHISPQISAKEGLLSKLFLLLKYDLIERTVFKHSKQIFSVSTNLIESLGSVKSKAIYVPHGIDTDYWCPQENETSTVSIIEKFVLVVGNNGVDKELLVAIVKSHPEIRFVVVGLRNFSFELSNVEQRSGISEQELKMLYQNCMLFLRPMCFATANNSILEAMSMNCPVLVSTPSGTYDYFQDAPVGLTVVGPERLIQGFGKEVARLSATKNKADFRIRQFTKENFDWRHIVDRLTGYYESPQNT